ncbi:MAG: hypothetical protein LC624_07545 [Halobacteriales archaeon]|nr:hypothetical protein [Halobacteriales archaeon]
MRSALLVFVALLVLPAPALAVVEPLPVGPIIGLSPLPDGAGLANSCVVVLTGTCRFACDAEQPFLITYVSPVTFVRLTCAGRVLFEDHPIVGFSVYSPLPLVYRGIGPLHGVGTCEAWGPGVMACANTPLPA